MDRANPAHDASSFIVFAKEQMGNVQAQGTLANAFFNATEYHPTQSYPNFWQVGCVFDTILDYFLALKEAGQLNDEDRALMATLLARAVQGYQAGIVGRTAAWYDDWCWWGIAASKAFVADYEDIFGAQCEFFRSTAMDLWGLVDSGDFATVANSIPDRLWADSAYQSNGEKFTKAILSARSELHAGTRNAWALIERGQGGNGTPRQNADYEHFTTEAIGKWAVPRFPGGCWQYDLSTLPFPCDDGPDWEDPDPAHNFIGVFQLTLMPGLYLSFACSLLSAAKRKAAEGTTGESWDRLQQSEAYQRPAEEVVGFLTKWLEAGPPDSLASAFPVGVLVHERTPTYAALSDGTFPPLQSYNPEAYWGGDQGLIMGALTQYSQLVGAVLPAASEAAPPVFETYPAALLKGVFHNMPSEELPGTVGPFRAGGDGSPFDGDPDDYGSGSGVFWRHVLRCCRLDPRFGAEAGKDATIVAVATKSGTHVNSWGNDLFRPFNTVAAAIGAWYLLK